MRRRLVVAASAAGVAVAAGLGRSIARALTAPPAGRRYSIRIHGVDDGDRLAMLLDDTEQTRLPGCYGLLIPDGSLVRLGPPTPTRHGLVSRAIDPADIHVLEHSRVGSWTGIQFATPADAGLSVAEETIAAPAGRVPAWRIPGAGRGDVWAIHIHGLGSTRAGTLRGVQVAAEHGMTSLVTTYRNTAEGPVLDRGRSMLGGAEADDVEAALEHAVQNGAQQLVLFGWSLGANIALQLAHRPRWRERVAGVVADSPVLDWRATLAANCRRSGLPAWTAHLAYPWLTRPMLARRIGLPAAIDLDALDWTRPGRLRVPSLILQGTADTSTPWTVPQRIAGQNHLVSIELFDADHTMSWNSDPARWRSTVASWLDEHVGDDAPPIRKA